MHIVSYDNQAIENDHIALTHTLMTESGEFTREGCYPPSPRKKEEKTNRNRRGSCWSILRKSLKHQTTNAPPETGLKNFALNKNSSGTCTYRMYCSYKRTEGYSRRRLAYNMIYFEVCSSTYVAKCARGEFPHSIFWLSKFIGISCSGRWHLEPSAPARLLCEGLQHPPLSPTAVVLAVRANPSLMVLIFFWKKQRKSQQQQQ